MKNLKIYALAIALLSSGIISAQKWITGKDLSYLKGQKELLLQFTYDNMMVGKNSESDYVKEKVEDYNKKEAGKGDAWAKAWTENRASGFEPKFEELFNKTAGDKLSADRKKTSAKYTLIIHTVMTEPGWNIGISKKPAACNYELLIVETANPSNVLSKGVLNGVPGSQFGGYDYDSSTRIKECYAKAGKTLGGKLAKATK